MKNVLFLCLVLGLAGCGGGGGSDPPKAVIPPVTGIETIANLERMGKLPILDRSPEAQGPDVDRNGVRDDIDRWIQTQPYSDTQKKAALQSAKALQDTLSININDIARLRTAHDNITRAVVCVHRQFPPSQAVSPSVVLSTLQKYTMNTKDRVMTYLKFNDALNGSSTELPRGDTCV